MSSIYSSEKKFHPSDILAMARRRKRPALSTFVVLFIAFMALAVLLPPVYRSTATVLIEQQEIPQDLVRSTVTSFADQRIQVITQRAMTFAKLSEIIKKYNLYEDMRQSDPLEQVVEKMRKDINHQMISADVVDPRSGRPVEATIAFSISYLSEDPRIAQKVTNEIVSVFLEENLRNRKEMAVQAEEFLGDELKRLGDKATAIEESLARFKEENLRSLPEQTNLNISILDREEREYTEAGRRLQVLEEQRVNLKSQLGLIDPYRPVIGDGDTSTMTTEARVKFLQNRYLSLSAIYSDDHPDVIKVRRELDELMAGAKFNLDQFFVEKQIRILKAEQDRLRMTYAADHPDILRNEKQLEQYEKAIGNFSKAGENILQNSADNPAYIQISASLQSVEIEIAHIKESRKSIKEKIEGLELSLLDAPRIEKSYRDLTRDLENTLMKYQEVKAKQLEAQMSHALEIERKGERFTLIEPPMVPERPVKPNRILIALLGIIASIGATGGLIWLLEKYDRKISSIEDVVRITGQYPLAIVPHIETLDEISHKKNRAKIMTSAAGVTAVIIMAVFHWMVIPLDVLLFVILRKLG